MVTENLCNFWANKVRGLKSCGKGGKGCENGQKCSENGRNMLQEQTKNVEGTT